MKKLNTIDAGIAQRLFDRLYYTVRCNLVPKKGHDNFLKDKQAREVTWELVGHIDGLSVTEGFEGPKHSSNDYMGVRDDSLEAKVKRSIAARPHLLPVMNGKPTPPEE